MIQAWDNNITATFCTIITRHNYEAVVKKFLNHGQYLYKDIVVNMIANVKVLRTIDLYFFKDLTKF